MTNDEAVALVEALRGKGIVKFKLDTLEVEFAKRDDSDFDPIAMMEKATEDAKAELYKLLSEDERANIDKKLLDQLTYGSS